jgi:hypothetical protein
VPQTHRRLKNQLSLERRGISRGSSPTFSKAIIYQFTEISSYDSCLRTVMRFSIGIWIEYYWLHENVSFTIHKLSLVLQNPIPAPSHPKKTTECLSAIPLHPANTNLNLPIPYVHPIALRNASPPSPRPKLAHPHLSLPNPSTRLRSSIPFSDLDAANEADIILLLAFRDFQMQLRDQDSC